jgi:NAD(P)-dependent dehydrogenase (short-subunit alcohol dehydrogenase family)
MSGGTKTVVVTGATAGIGRHVALDLAQRGHRVFATGRNEAALEKLEMEATARGTTLGTVMLDVTDAKSIADAASVIRRETGGRGIDVLVNNAGYGQGGPVIELTDEVLRQQFETNVFGLMAVTRAFAPEMIARGKGWIINVSSIGGRVTFPFFGAYHASKYAVEALSDAMRAELHSFGVRVVLVEPGPIQSEFSERAFTSLPQGNAAVRFASSYDRAGGIRTVTDRYSFGPEHVARAIRRAMGDSPRARYVAPSFLGLVLALLPFIPTRLVDALFRAAFGLRRARPPVLEGAAAK